MLRELLTGDRICELLRANSDALPWILAVAVLGVVRTLIDIIRSPMTWWAVAIGSVGIGLARLFNWF